MGNNSHKAGRWVMIAAVIAGLACLGVAVPSAVAIPAVRGAVPSAGSWGRAIEVPGLAVLNTGGSAAVRSVSCGSAGNCAAGGYYQNRHGHWQGFVALKRGGRWGRAIEVPGLAALNTGGDALVTSVSCVPAGSCAAGGDYGAPGNSQVFVAVERGGRWGRAIEVPGLAALNTGGDAEVSSVSCGSAGSCAAGGYYHSGDSEQGFVVLERGGRWGRAIEVPGLAALNTGDAEVSSVSCGSAGSCAAGGDYNDGISGFVVLERDGRWGRAIEVPGLAALSTDGFAAVRSVSCASAGSCAAGGYYNNGSSGQGFVVVERDGVWGTAIEVPGLAALNTGGGAQVTSVSCGSAGSCVAGGDYEDQHASTQGFVAVERDGVWGTAIEVPGLAALNKGDAEVSSVSCGSAGNCAVGGSYLNSLGHPQGFVVRERDGVWGRAIEVPGLAALDKGQYGAVSSVSCAPAGRCVASGSYHHLRQFHGFVT